jgi:hypothetical protein
MTMPVPTKPPPAPPKAAPIAPPSATASAPVSKLKISKGTRAAAQRIVVYAPGGAGKSTLCSLLPAAGVEPVFLDVEGGSDHLDVARLGPDDGMVGWAEMREALNGGMLDEYGAIVLDSGTKAEEFCTQHVIATVKHEKGAPINRLEDYGYGKGYTFVFDEFMLLLQDLDARARAGQHVIVICHEESCLVPNPLGVDYLRWEPRMQQGNKARTQVRSRLVEWANHVLRIGYDVSVDDHGKATGVDSRQIYAHARPHFLAKSRTLTEPMYSFTSKDDASVWTAMFANQEK